MANRKDRKHKRAERVREKRRQEVQRNTPAAMARRASNSPWAGCHISAGWTDPMRLTQIMAARRLPDGRLVFAVFLLDRACLGLKNGFLRAGTLDEYEDMVAMIDEHDPMMSCEPALAAKVLGAGIDYATELGFDPQADAWEALAILGDVDPAACGEQVAVGGSNGKPFFVAGPRDNVPRIMAHLRDRLGDDGFDWLGDVEMLAEAGDLEW
ncbi:MAG: hypothetical protein WC058_05620 [Phycisphaeraceae bacterium]